MSFLDEPGSKVRVAGNARLTALTGLALLVLFLAQIVTVLLGVADVLTAHVVIGLMLAPPVLVKMSSTGWRILRYYRGDQDFVERGAPRPFLRILGPILAALTVVLIGSGILAFYTHGGLYAGCVKTHKVVFYLWLVAVVSHVIPHFVDSVSWAAADLSVRMRLKVPGAVARRVTIAVALSAGAVLGGVVSGHVGAYFHDMPFRVHL